MTILQRIVKTKRTEVERARSARPLTELVCAAKESPPVRDFVAAVLPQPPGDIRLIAEMKKASPSAGVIVPDYDPAALARVYHRNGADALSVLTDHAYFQGSLDHLAVVRAAAPLPVLRKDFIVDEYQLFESRVAGADAVLLIVEAVGLDVVANLATVARQIGLAVLIEVHAERNLAALLGRLGPPTPDSYLLGINSRDLAVQRTDLSTVARLAAFLPPGCPFVAESGIATRHDVEQAIRAGAGAMLVGESILRAPDIGRKIDELLGRPTSGQSGN